MEAVHGEINSSSHRGDQVTLGLSQRGDEKIDTYIERRQSSDAVRKIIEDRQILAQ